MRVEENYLCTVVFLRGLGIAKPFNLHYLGSVYSKKRRGGGGAKIPTQPKPLKSFLPLFGLAYVDYLAVKELIV